MTLFGTTGNRWTLLKTQFFESMNAVANVPFDVLAVTLIKVFRSMSVHFGVSELYPNAFEIPETHPYDLAGIEVRIPYSPQGPTESACFADSVTEATTGVKN